MTHDSAYLSLLALCQHSDCPCWVRTAARRIEAERAASSLDGLYRIYTFDLSLPPTGPTGYSEGTTREIAIETALTHAGDPNAYFDGRLGCVLYRSQPA